MDALLEVVRKTWGYAGLRPLQGEAMRASLEGRDAIVVLPTGGGKSLCCQAPALVAGGLTVVVSPLISLMKDQVDRLKVIATIDEPEVVRKILRGMGLPAEAPRAEPARHPRNRVSGPGVPHSHNVRSPYVALGLFPRQPPIESPPLGPFGPPDWPHKPSHRGL